MHTGKELGEAIRVAIEKKIDLGVSKKQIAVAFGIKEPSIADWIKKGSIGKERLPKLWRYFSDVVDMEHWGLSPDDFSCFGLVPKNCAAEPLAQYESPRTQRIKALVSATEQISDSGIDHLTSYATWIASQYPKAKANRVN
jgi:hypothetical protein